MAGTIAADTLTHSTAGSIATNYVVEGTAKHWVHFNGTGTPSVQDSFNNSSITDNASSDYSLNFSSNMSNANYIQSGTCGWDNTGWGGNLFHYEGHMTTGTYRIITARPDSLATREMLSVMPMATGDLA